MDKIDYLRVLLKAEMTAEAAAGFPQIEPDSQQRRPQVSGLRHYALLCRS
jgi:hypothetical protein